jgi:glycosyltransferase involved in cell wall biosynthesis
MRLAYLPTVGTKHADAIVHSVLSSVAAMAHRPDIIHYQAIGPGLVAPLPRALSSAKILLTVHGLDGLREKWGPGARKALALAEWMSGRVPDATIVVSRALARHYRARYGTDATFIPNGVDAREPSPAREIVSRYRLRPGSYLLFVGRLVPEKAPHLLVRAFRQVRGDIRLVIAGGSSFTDRYVESLTKEAARDHRVIMTGYVFGTLLDELYSNAAAFVLPSALEGLPLTLLEAASFGVPIVASDIEPHVEIIGDVRPGCRMFRSGDQGDLARVMSDVIDALPVERVGGARMRRTVLERYSWESSVDAIEQLYLAVVAGRTSARDRAYAGPPPRSAEWSAPPLHRA